MWATEHEGLTGVTFDSDGHRLVGVLYLARGPGPKPTVLLLHGCPGLEKNLDLAAVLRDREKQLAAEKAALQEQWAAAHMDLPALAEEVHRLSGEIERLRGLPPQQDTGPSGR